jgi:sugar lactone lactonase YvrE
MHTRTRALLATIALLAALASAPQVASAAELRLPSVFSPITGAGSSVTIHRPSGIGVDETSGNVFLADGGEGNALQILGAEGGAPADLVSPFQISGFAFGYEPSGSAVDNSATSPSKGTVYVVDVQHSRVEKYVRNGTTEHYEAAGQLNPSSGVLFREPLGATVDTNGNLFVADYGSRSVVKFSPAGTQLARIGTESTVGPPSSVAVDSAGDLFVQGYGGNAVYKYPANGAGEIESSIFTKVVDSGSTGIAVQPGTNTLFVALGNHVTEYDATTLAKMGEFGYGTLGETARLAINGSTNRVYVSDTGKANVAVFGAPVVVPDVTVGPPASVGHTDATLTGHVDPVGAGNVTACEFEYGTTTVYSLGSVPCSPAASGGSPFTGPTETTYHYRLVATNANGTNASADSTLTPHAVKETATNPVTNLAATSATLNGSFDPDNLETHYYFEYGESTSYGEVVPVGSPPGEMSSTTAPGTLPVSKDIGGLVFGETYHFRLVASNSLGTSAGEDRTFTTSTPPAVDASVSDVHSDSALIHFQVNPDGLETTYHLEYGVEDCAVSTCTATPVVHLPAGVQFQPFTHQLSNLEAGTTYHFRIVAQNERGAAPSVDHEFTTFSFVPVINDPCANALSRQQTGAALLPDCRAYELVSAGNAGGYNVESDLIAGQEPFSSYPNADGRVLYGMHNGGIPKTGNPTNNGVDPYISTRGSNGWSTRYVGIPANGTPSSSPFASSLLAASASLDTFAFGGPNICAPCFEDGSAGVPIRTPDGQLRQGMVAASNVTKPSSSAEPDGYVARAISADGSHLVFGSTTRFAAGGNDSTGDVSIYDRNLDTGETRVVSNSPGATPLACEQGATHCHSPGDGDGIAELDLSSDGSRIVVAQKVSTDAEGNNYWHLYMSIDDSPSTIDLTPGVTAGVLYDGMTDDGSTAFFTTRDKLLPSEDTDESADIYEAEVDGSGSLSLSLVSVLSDGSPSNSDVCSPPGSPTSWNAASGDGKCNAVAFAGSAGAASGNGTFYFISPELLDAAQGGVQDQPNLYVARPGQTPEFVATMDSSFTKPTPVPARPVENSSLVVGLPIPEAVTVDQSNGDLYVYSRASATVSRFTSSGAPHNFSSSGSNEIFIGSIFSEAKQAGIAIDTAPGSPFYGDFYVTIGGPEIRVFAPSGEQIGSLGGFGKAAGVAVDPSNGAVYATEAYGETVQRFTPVAGTLPVSKDDYVETSITPQGMKPGNLGVDTAGHVYVQDLESGLLKQFKASFFEPSRPTKAGRIFSTTSNTLTVDLENNDIYVDEGGEIARLDSGGELIQKFGSGVISSSSGVAINETTKHVYASTASKIVEFGFFEPPFAPIDNPAIVHAVDQAGVHDYEDFQVSPTGTAVFPSALSITGYDNAGHMEVYLYDPQGSSPECGSCAPTGTRATGDAALPSHGLSITDDGRVFFNSTDPLVPRDLNNRKDVYEWDEGTIQLISTGASLFDSSLLGASADGTDAYFFTRDTLVPQGDENGRLVKIYDARSLGGFPFVPAPALCRASDECHGPGSSSPRAQSTGTLAGDGGNVAIRKHKKHRKHHHKRRKHHRRHHKPHTTGRHD